MYILTKMNTVAMFIIYKNINLYLFIYLQYILWGTKWWYPAH